MYDFTVRSIELHTANLGKNTALPGREGAKKVSFPGSKLSGADRPLPVQYPHVISA